MRLLLDQPIGEQPQISAAEEADALAHHVGHADGKFQQAFVGAKAMRIATPFAHAAVGARRGKHRRIVLISRVRQRVEEPRRVGGRREARCAISDYGLTGNVFQQQARAVDIAMKLIATLLKDQLMSVAVRGDFMAAGSSFFHQVRKALADPAEKEAGDLHVAFAEDVEQAGEILFDVRRQPCPFAVIGGVLGRSRMWNQSSTSTENMEVCMTGRWRS